jgi:hypothetical protein
VGEGARKSGGVDGGNVQTVLCQKWFGGGMLG